jgi:hypothetical protein
LAAFSEENQENIRALEGGCVHWHVKKAIVGNSEKNHENLNVLEGGRVHWHMKKAYIGNSF